MYISEIIAAIEEFAPPVYQEAYDNAGLQIGSVSGLVRGVLLALDVTEAVVAEAVDRSCNLIIAHHPLIFMPLRRVTGNGYVERAVESAIRHNIAVYAAHTNLDNMRNGVSAHMAEKLSLERTIILAMKMNTLSKLYTYVPQIAAEKVRDALFAAGAGDIGRYTECSYNIAGSGTFRPDGGAHPAIGQAGGEREWVEEVKIEVLVAKHRKASVMKALFETHPYEEVAFEFIDLQNPNQEIGAGIIGYLPAPLSETECLSLIKRQFNTQCIRHTVLNGKMISKVAICGGSGSFLLQDAISASADIFITADYKYHQFFDADGRIIIADIGHYESEQYTVEIFESILKKKFPNFAVLFSKVRTNPINYFC